MKIWSSACTCLVIIIYVILIFFFISLKREYLPWKDTNQKFKNCSTQNVCLTFCEETDDQKFSDEFINENFPIYDFSIEKFNVIWNKLECRVVEDKKIINNHHDFGISSEGFVKFYDKSLIGTEYCLRLFKGENLLKMNLEFCTTNFSFLNFNHYFLLIVTAVFLIIPSTVYVAFKEISETFNGKLCVALIIAHLLLIFIDLLPFINYDFYRISAFIGFFSIIFIINFMNFDIYATFKHFNEPQKQSKCFKKFVYFLIIYLMIIMVPVSGFKSVYESFHSLPILLILFVLTFFLDILTLIASVFYLLILKKSLRANDDSRFDMEKERFWLYMKLFAIMTIIWSVEMKLTTMYNSYESEIIADIIKCFSAGLSAFVLIWTSQVYSLVLGKYRTIKNLNV
ncbi:hypothetical protein PVAND_011084 [Polypedilum vanderplanki]|uniref:Uncharacterized protein n=1 Tax=Polypedilum vanderplanki TaxID=319348 RepID=A0A9J6CJC4_POLVA|nr:hypothetical protein PVAND_011084 [Polypedilum vanderplanki]